MAVCEGFNVGAGSWHDVGQLQIKSWYYPDSLPWSHQMSLLDFQWQQSFPPPPPAVMPVAAKNESFAVILHLNLIWWLQKTILSLMIIGEDTY